MKIEKFVAGPLGNNCYVIYDEKARLATVIDVPEDSADRIYDFLRAEKLKALYIINTHGHFDHIYENARLKSLTSAKIAIHGMDRNWLSDPQPQGVLGKFKLRPSKADIVLSDNEEIAVGSVNLKVLHTPGHTPGSICLYDEKDRVLFSGDTLMKGTFGRTDLWGGNDSDMKKTLRKLAQLPGETKVMPGHERETTIKDEIVWMREF